MEIENVIKYINTKKTPIEYRKQIWIIYVFYVMVSTYIASSLYNRYLLYLFIVLNIIIISFAVFLTLKLQERKKYLFIYIGFGLVIIAINISIVTLLSIKIIESIDSKFLMVYVIALLAFTILRILKIKMEIDKIKFSSENKGRKTINYIAGAASFGLIGTYLLNWFGNESINAFIINYLALLWSAWLFMIGIEYVFKFYLIKKYRIENEQIINI